MDEQLQRKLRHLGRAVFDAISESPDVNDALDTIRSEGYSLSMQLNCRKGDVPEPSSSVSDADPTRLVVSSRSVSASGTPAFRIHNDDLTFLRSIGIDPTRRTRRRR